MKLKALLAALARAALCVSVASASTAGHGKGKGEGKDHGRGNDPAQTTTSTDGDVPTPTDSSAKHHGKSSEQKGKSYKRDRKAGATGSTSCKGRQLVLRGLYVSGSAAAGGAGSFVMVIKRVNGHGKKLGLAGKQATLTVDSSTKYRRHGHAALTDLVANDRLNVKVRACRAASTGDAGDAGTEATDPPAVTLLAKKVDARPAKTGGDTDTGTTSTGTTTTETGDTMETDTGPSTS